MLNKNVTELADIGFCQNKTNKPKKRKHEHYHRPLYPLVITILYDALMAWALYATVLTKLNTVSAHDHTLLVIAGVVYVILIAAFSIKFLNYYRLGLSRADIRELRGFRTPTRDDQIHNLKVSNILLWILYMFK